MNHESDVVDGRTPTTNKASNFWWPDVQHPTAFSSWRWHDFYSRVEPTARATCRKYTRQKPTSRGPSTKITRFANQSGHFSPGGPLEPPQATPPFDLFFFWTHHPNPLSSLVRNNAVRSPSIHKAQGTRTVVCPTVMVVDVGRDEGRSCTVEVFGFSIAG
jgi:hypothetical protein